MAGALLFIIVILVCYWSLLVPSLAEQRRQLCYLVMVIWSVVEVFLPVVERGGVMAAALLLVHSSPRL